MTRTGFEPVLPPWKGGVLTAWPTGQVNLLRRVRDSNPWDSLHHLHDFQSCSFGLSDNSPEWKKLNTLSQNENSGSRTRTYDIMINSHALLPTELCRNNISVATSYSHKGQPLTTIGTKKLNFCVRHGYRCILLAIATTLWCYLLLSKFCSLKTGFEVI